jgi:hypothetical protein
MKLAETTIIEELKEIKKSSEDLIGINVRYTNDPTHRINHFELCYQIDEIINEYNWIIPKVNELMKKLEFDLTLEEIKEIKKDWEDLKKKPTEYTVVDHKLRRISLKCGRILSILNNLATKTIETKNRFEGIKKEIDALKKLIPLETYDNLKEALTEFESNHLLATTLICGRICVYHLDLISGNINEKIGKMKEKGVLKPKGASEMILRAEKKVRELFAHDLKYSPSSSITLSIFGDTINLVEKITEYKKHSPSPKPL